MQMGFETVIVDNKTRNKVNSSDFLGIWLFDFVFGSIY